MFWHLLSRKLFNMKIFAWKVLVKIWDSEAYVVYTIRKTSSGIGRRHRWWAIVGRVDGGSGSIWNKSGRDFCPLAVQSIISAWKTYGKGSYFFPSIPTGEKKERKKLVMLSFVTVKFLKFCWWYLRSFPDIRNRSAVIIIIKTTMPYRIFHLYNTNEHQDCWNYKNPIYAIYIILY